MNYAEVTANLVLAMSEEQQKAVYECLLMLFNLKQEKGEEKATNPTTKPKTAKKNAYEANDTMRMIGRQNIYKYIDNQEIGRSIQEITQARGYDLNRNFDIIFDMFLYGVITGKRQERAKKKATNPTTKQGKRLFQ